MVSLLGLALPGGADPGRLRLAWLLRLVEQGQGGLPGVCPGFMRLTPDSRAPAEADPWKVCVGCNPCPCSGVVVVVVAAAAAVVVVVVVVDDDVVGDVVVDVVDVVDVCG